MVMLLRSSPIMEAATIASHMVSLILACRAVSCGPLAMWVRAALKIVAITLLGVRLSQRIFMIGRAINTANSMA